MNFMHKLASRLARLKALTAWAAALTVAFVFACEKPVALTGPGSNIAQFVVSPKNVTLQPNQTEDFVAVGLTATGDSADVSVTWTATGGSVTGSSNGKLHYGHYQNDRCGSFQVVATSNPGNMSDNANVTVTGCTVAVASVSVTPPSATVLAGQSVQLTATPKDANGSPLTGRTVTWSSSATAVAIVNGSGLVTGRASGAATITATSEGQRGTAEVTVTARPQGRGEVLVGAGDIADCGSSGAEATAALLDAIPGTVFTAGDNAYSSGTASEYANCYDPTWGRHKARTRPAPGNHEYNTSDAAPYYAYFGANAGPSGRGYYSYDLGDWHLISLNSNIDMSAGSAQELWLRADLAATTKTCVLAYWHHPRFSSGSHGSSTESQPLWQALYDYNADVVVVGHDHNYQRFAPQTPSGAPDPVRGIREFVAGTGGRSHYSFSTPIANTEAYNTDTWGVLKLTLDAASYSWEFIPIAGGTYRDSGTGACH